MNRKDGTRRLIYLGPRDGAVVIYDASINQPPDLFIANPDSIGQGEMPPACVTAAALMVMLTTHPDLLMKIFERHMNANSEGNQDATAESGTINPQLNGHL